MTKIIIQEDDKDIMVYNDVEQYYILGMEKKNNKIDFISYKGDPEYLINSLDAHSKRLLKECMEKSIEIK